MTNNDEMALKLEQIEWLHGAAEETAAVNLKMTMKPEEILQITSMLLALLAERDVDKKVIAESAVLFETLRQEVLALERDVDAANARVDTKCAQLCNQDEEIEMLRLRIAELEARTVAHDVGVMNIGNPYCEDHLVAWTVTGRQLAAGIYYLDARRVGDIKLEVGE